MAYNRYKNSVLTLITMIEIFDIIDFIDSEVNLEFGNIDNNQIKMNLSINDKLVKL